MQSMRLLLHCGLLLLVRTLSAQEDCTIPFMASSAPVLGGGTFTTLQNEGLYSPTALIEEKLKKAEAIIAKLPRAAQQDRTVVDSDLEAAQKPRVGAVPKQTQPYTQKSPAFRKKDTTIDANEQYNVALRNGRERVSRIEATIKNHPVMGRETLDTLQTLVVEINGAIKAAQCLGEDHSETMEVYHEETTQTTYFAFPIDKIKNDPNYLYVDDPGIAIPIRAKKYGVWGYLDANYDKAIEFQYYDALPFYQGKAPVQKFQNEDWKLIDDKGATVLVLTGVREIRPFSTGIIWVRYADKMTALLDYTGNIIIDRCAEISYFGTPDYILVQKNGKNQLVDKTGRVVADDFQGIEKWQQNNLILVRKNDRVGLSTYSGKVIVPPTMIAIEPIDSSGFGHLQGGYPFDVKYGLYHKDGVFIQPEYSKKIVYEGSYARVWKGNEWGILDRDGKVVLPVEYHSLEWLENGTALIGKHKVYGLADKRYNILLPAGYEKIILQKIKNQFYYKVKRSYWTLLDSKFNEVLKKGPYTYLSDFDRFGLARYQDTSGTKNYGLVNYKGKRITEPIYAQLDTFSAKLMNHAQFYQNSRGCGLIDTNGQVVIPPQHSRIVEFPEGKMYGFANDGTDRILIDRSGRIIVPESIYKETWQYSSYIKIEIDKEATSYLRAGVYYGFNPAAESWLYTKELRGYVLLDAQKLTPIYARLLDETSDPDAFGNFIVRKNNQSGLLHNSGKLLGKGIVYDTIYPQQEGIYRVREKGLYIYWDPTGEKLTDPPFEEASDFRYGLAVIKSGGKYGLVNKHNGRPLPPLFSAIREIQPKVFEARTETGEIFLFDVVGTGEVKCKTNCEAYKLLRDAQKR